MFECHIYLWRISWRISNSDTHVLTIPHVPDLAVHWYSDVRPLRAVIRDSSVAATLQFFNTGSQCERYLRCDGAVLSCNSTHLVRLRQMLHQDCFWLHGSIPPCFRHMKLFERVVFVCVSFLQFLLHVFLIFRIVDFLCESYFVVVLLLRHRKA